ncbi:MAG: T9SS type A sorting domain-containing protein, partial [Chitinophagaceae bacterium]
RIRLINSNTKVQEISNTLMVKMDNGMKDLEIINSMMSGGSPVLTVRSFQDELVDLQIADMSGRMISKTKITLNNGTNNVSLTPISSARGFLIIVLSCKDHSVSKRMLIQ